MTDNEITARFAELNDKRDDLESEIFDLRQLIDSLEGQRDDQQAWIDNAIDRNDANEDDELQGAIYALGAIEARLSDLYDDVDDVEGELANVMFAIDELWES